MSLDLQSLAQFAATTVTRSAAPKNASLLSVEEAREAVQINVAEPKGSVDAGKQYITLKLGQVKLSLEAIAPKMDRLAVEEDQVEAVSAVLRENIDAGVFDEAIVAGQKQIADGYAKAQARKNAKLEPVEAATEEEAVEAVGGLDLDALDDELDV